MQGIDINKYQAGISLSAVPADFVIVGVSDGIGWAQPHWRAQAEAALAAGKRLGLYHWAHGNGNSMAEEAAWFVQCVEPYAGRAVMFLDWEDPRALRYGPAGAKLWLDSVYTLLGVTPLIYLNGNGLRSGSWAAVAAEYPLWYAGGTAYDVRMNGYHPPAYPQNVAYWGRPALFQFTQFGRLPGYGGDLDLNVSSWDGAAWDAQARGGRSQPGGAQAGPLDAACTHLLYASQGRMYLLCLATYESQWIPDPKVLKDTTYVLTKAGWRVKDWNQLNGAGIEVGDINAFGRQI